MAKRQYPSIAEYYNEICREAIDNCIFCGDCLNDCPVLPFSNSKSDDQGKILQNLIDFLNGGPVSEEVYHQAFSCSGCGHCSDSCPHGIDVLMLHEGAKIELVKRGEKTPEAVNFIIPNRTPNLKGVLSALQIQPSEERWLKRAPSSPQKTENLFFIGCDPLIMPHKIFASLDILESMGIDFVALAGGELCCGVPSLMAGGNPTESEEMARDLMSNINAFSPKRVILVCPGCYRQFTELFPRFLDYDFEVQFLTQFLNENIDKISFTKPVGKKITLHDSCMTQRTELTDSIIRTLESIPGLTLLGKELSKEKVLCCGGIANMTYPDIGKQVGHVLVEETIKLGGDKIADSCPGCMFAFYLHSKEFPLNVSDISLLINDAIGGKHYEDKLANLWKYESLDELIDTTRGNFEANGYPEEMMRHILPNIFPFAGS